MWCQTPTYKVTLVSVAVCRHCMFRVHDFYTSVSRETDLQSVSNNANTSKRSDINFVQIYYILVHILTHLWLVESFDWYSSHRKSLPTCEHGTSYRQRKCWHVQYHCHECIHCLFLLAQRQRAGNSQPNWFAFRTNPSLASSKNVWLPYKCSHQQTFTAKTQHG